MTVARSPARRWALVLFALMVASGALGVAAVVLEYLGTVQDFGLVLGVVSLALSIIFGVGGASAFTVAQLETGVANIVERIDRLAIVLDDIRRILDERLPR